MCWNPKSYVLGYRIGPEMGSVNRDLVMQPPPGEQCAHLNHLVGVGVIEHQLS